MVNVMLEVRAAIFGRVFSSRSRVGIGAHGIVLTHHYFNRICLVSVSRFFNEFCKEFCHFFFAFSGLDSRNLALNS